MKGSPFPLKPTDPGDRLLIAANIGSYTELSRIASGNASTQIARHARLRKLPSNHPIIPTLAGRLHISPREFVTIFSAKGKPMAEREVKRLTTRFLGNGNPSSNGNGHVPVTPPEAPPARKPGRPSAHSRLIAPSDANAMLAAAGFASLNGLITAVRGSSSQDFQMKLSERRVAPNHPAIPAYAKALKITPAQFIATFSVNGEALAPGMVDRIARGYKDYSPAASEATDDRPKRGYNRLKGKALNLRQATRSIITTLNTVNMAGERSITIPADAMTVFVQDYIERAKLKGQLLISPAFAEQFG